MAVSVTVQKVYGIAPRLKMQESSLKRSLMWPSWRLTTLLPFGASGLKWNFGTKITKRLLSCSGERPRHLQGEFRITIRARQFKPGMSGSPTSVELTSFVKRKWAIWKEMNNMIGLMLNQLQHWRTFRKKQKHFHITDWADPFVHLLLKCPNRQSNSQLQ